MGHYVYLLECSDPHGSLYVGYTTDVGRRVEEHNAGQGAKFTRGRTPVSLRYVEFWESKSAAMGREWELKQYTRPEKEHLVATAEESVRVVLDPPPDLESG